ncbi:MAG: D-aminopeptidase [Haliscomenobacter sp.]|jgi:CubicO group peptidase (beta-lactamase class C family)|nr:D-aminopeptidase [Haliscomenobacter sp.]
MKRIPHFAFFALLLTFSLPLLAGPWVARHGLTSAQYQQEFNKWTAQGYRPRQVSCYAVGSNVLYAAIFEKDGGPAYVARHNMTSAQYQQEYNTHTGNGYRLTSVDATGAGANAVFAAIWEKDNGPATIARHNLTSAQYQQEYNTHTGNGYRLVHVEGYGVGATAYYTAIWEKKTGPSMVARHNLTAAQYQQEFNTHVGNGYRLTHVSGFNVGNTDFYAAIWEKDNGPGFAARHRINGNNAYQIEFDNQVFQGYKPKCVNGYALNNTPHYAAIWENTPWGWSGSGVSHIDKTIGDFMKKYSVPGAAVALVKDGRLVFAKGYGDANQSTGENVSPNHLFRIASVSKPITGVTIMKLVEQGKLKLTDKVFGPGSILGNTYGTSPLNTNELNITVKHLLEHTAGGTNWDNDGDDGVGDPMFSNTNMTQAQLITWVLDNRNPSAAPGTTYAYSNFGFCVLGRIVEKVTGQTYENYVKNNILKPCGADDMHIAGDALANKRPNEVVYYGGNPYGMKVARMDAHGGWIASPVDLMRFLVKVDGFNTKPDILSAPTFTTMMTGSSANAGYGKGWSVTGNNYWHNGSLPGTGAIMVRAGNGLSWVFLTNTRGADPFFSDMDKMMWNVVNGITAWPAHDLF